MEDKGKRKDTKLPETLRIVNIISEGLEICCLTMTTIMSHIQMVNLVVPEYGASDLEYEHLLTFFSHEVQRLRHPHDDALVIFLKVANVLL